MYQKLGRAALILAVPAAGALGACSSDDRNKPEPPTPPPPTASTPTSLALPCKDQVRLGTEAMSRLSTKSGDLPAGSVEVSQWPREDFGPDIQYQSIADAIRRTGATGAITGFVKESYVTNKATVLIIYKTEVVHGFNAVGDEIRSIVPDIARDEYPVVLPHHPTLGTTSTATMARHRGLDEYGEHEMVNFVVRGVRVAGRDTWVQVVMPTGDIVADELVRRHPDSAVEVVAQAFDEAAANPVPEADRQGVRSLFECAPGTPAKALRVPSPIG